MNSSATCDAALLIHLKIQTNGGRGKRKCYASIFFVFYNLYTYKPNPTKHLPLLFDCLVELDAMRSPIPTRGNLRWDSNPQPRD